MNYPIPEERKRILDNLFDAFSVVTEGTYAYICDMRYDFSRWSQSAVDAFLLPGVYMEEAGAIWGDYIHPDEREYYFKSIDEIFTGEAVTHDLQYRVRKPDGEYVFCTCKGIVLRDADGEPEYFCGIIRNHGVQDYVDKLTGLRNSYGFFEDLQAFIKKNIPVKVTMLGIVRFTDINDLYGYQFGNMVLQKFSRYLLEHSTEECHIYRLDGTKFAIISENHTLDEVRASYERLRAHFRAGVIIEGKHVIFDMNAGLFSLEDFSVNYQTVYACLSFAYGESKVRRQGDLVEFYNNLTEENRQRVDKLHAIRLSVARDYEGFFLVYQPVVDAHTEKLVAAEALLRWKNEVYGMVPPDHFIPILEKDPIFPKLGCWILKKALTDAAEIRKTVPDFVIHVNLSYTQLERPDFVDMVSTVLEETGYPPENLCLEITERCRLLDMTLLESVVTRLRGMGIKVALDDFGTGFASIGLVKNLPFDIIKVDRSFVTKIEEDAQERELMMYFSGLAATFGAHVCVEGIETAGMVKILQDYSVHSFQGYYYSKPLEIDAFMDWKRNR